MKTISKITSPTMSLHTLARSYTGQSLPAIAHDETLAQAAQMMRDRNIHHLPVILEDGTIVGLIADKDLPRGDRASINSAGLVRDFMSWPVETLDESASIADAAKLMLEKKISALLITSGDAIQGLVSTEDLLQALVRSSDGEGTLRSRANELESALYNSPVGSIAQVLADAGL